MIETRDLRDDLNWFEFKHINIGYIESKIVNVICHLPLMMKETHMKNFWAVLGTNPYNVFLSQYI